MTEEKDILDTVAENPEEYLVYYGEMSLKDWADNAQGESAEFWLDGQQDIHPFKPFKHSKRTPGGARFIALFIEIADDDKPVNQEQRKRVENALLGHVKGAKHAQAAGMTCKEKAFHEYLIVRSTRLDPQEKRAFTATLPHGLYKSMVETKMKIILDDPIVGEEFAKHFLYWHCAIRSRRDLDRKPKSFNEFSNLRDDYYKWQASR